MPINNSRSPHEHVLRTSVEVVDRVKPDDLSLPTPCAAWTLRDLLTHMTVQHHGFAAAARGNGADPEVWRPRPGTDDPVADYAAATDDVLSAFAQAGPEFRLPEITAEPVPAAMAMSMHLVDYVVHGWDVARTIGVPYEPDAEAVEAALAVALSVPDGPERRQPDAAFRPSVDADPTAGPLERILAALGRSTAWRSEHDGQQQ